MKKGFYWIISTQFLSSFADNALLIVAISFLQELAAPEWATPALRIMFVFSYVLLAAFVATFADSRPKGKVMFATNLIKITGLFLMLFSYHVLPMYGVILLSYGVVGFGAAAYSPAKYGILTELLPAEKLVVANGWIEGTTVSSIVLGMGAGSVLIREDVAQYLLSLNLPFADTASQAALWVVLGIYLLATLCNTQVPDTGVRYAKPNWQPRTMLKNFAHSVHTLWHDKLGQIALAVVTLFWGVAATLQLIVLVWAEQVLGI
ncbi:MAG: lysophospholipid transporter LplT, partial [Saezia sp.]